MRMSLTLALSLFLACGDDVSDGDSDASPGVDASVPTDGSVPADASTGTDAATPDGGPPVGTAGCGRAPSVATGEPVLQTLDVGGTTRDWAVWLPEGYDADRRYPVVYQFHGCSDNPMRENNNVRIERESGGDAIIVRGRAVDRCWDTAADGPDVAFFDALVTEVEANYCADSDRRFATGYSSGSFMSHRLACVRGDQLRGVATIAGGQGGSGCVGSVAALLIHDENDTTVDISASERARDAHLERNGCGETTSSVAPSPCEAYDGCDDGLPVVWCQTSGMNHSRQDDLAAPAFWGFFESL